MSYQIIDARNGAILSTTGDKKAALKAGADLSGALRLIKDDGKGGRTEDTEGTKKLAKQ